MEKEMAHGKSLELRYGATKTYETITTNEPSAVSFFGRPSTYRNPDRPIRKAKQLEQRRDAKARARANGKR